jgi:hypothetical protein
MTFLLEGILPKQLTTCFISQQCAFCRLNGKILNRGSRIHGGVGVEYKPVYMIVEAMYYNSAPINIAEFE